MRVNPADVVAKIFLPTEYNVPTLIHSEVTYTKSVNEIANVKIAYTICWILGQ